MHPYSVNIICLLCFLLKLLIFDFIGCQALVKVFIYIIIKNIEKLQLFLKDHFLNFVMVCGTNGYIYLIDHAYFPKNIDR